MDTILAEIPREGGEVLRISIGEFKGRKLLNIRIWYTDSESGELRPTKKGVTVNAGQYQNFMKAVESAAGQLGEG